MLDELRNLFLRALKCDDGITATVLVDEWNEAVKRVQNVFDNMTDKDPNAVPVVRCKDCKHSKGACIDLWGEPAIECITGQTHSDDWFCANGERKGGDE